MKITITNIQKIKGHTVINFTSNIGSGFATWMNSVKPTINYRYDVELDIEKTIREAVVADIDSSQDILLIDGSSMIMIGIIDSVESDGMAYLRLSPDCLIMIETGGYSIGKGKKVSLKLDFSDVEVTAQAI